MRISPYAHSCYRPAAYKPPRTVHLELIESRLGKGSTVHGNRVLTLVLIDIYQYFGSFALESFRKAPLAWG